MLRRCALIALVTLAGCQSYNFNPVGKCIIQPGSTRITLGAVSTADILFVVDDSGSMRSQQESLARNFGAFIDALAREQADRAQRGLEPLDFHVAITTSAVFENQVPSGAPVCTAAGAGLQCQIQFPATGQPYGYSCTTAGAPCGDLVSTYYAAQGGGCLPGVGVQGQPFPKGDFVGVGGNPRVLHFTKDLAWSTWGSASPDPRLTELVRQFQENIQVGTCGSGQEQHLEASRLALQKALRQGGLAQPPSVESGAFPHEGAKLVVVWVGDEDDCSSPADPNRAVLMDDFSPGDDSCVADAAQPDPAKRRQTPVQEYADWFLALGRPFAAAFITSSSCTVGADGKKVCQPGTCTCTAPAGQTVDPQCSGKSAGGRLKEMAGLLSARGVAVVEDSVCTYDFAETLKQIAELVRPPSGLQLPTQPASGDVTILRILGRDGSTSRVCTGPSADADWWFVDCDDASGAPSTGATQCLAIRAGSSCEANPGETYSAEYLGLVPTSGCGAAAVESSECATLLGGQAKDWRCELPQGQARGTCLCNGTGG